MKADVKKLNLVEAITHRQGSFGLRLVHAVFALTISLFFRRIELSNSENLPKKSGLIFVLNHPNALIDPALVFIALPRKIAFLAKSTLFKIPVLAFLIRLVGALPLYRQQDAGADVSKIKKLLPSPANY
jgi:1-acyl-sn-glycerol-3-phosphate acyltransferase